MRDTKRLSRRAFALRIGALSACMAGVSMLDGCQLMSPQASVPLTIGRTGFLYGGTREAAHAGTDAFGERLRLLGWIEGDNLADRVALH